MANAENMTAEEIEAAVTNICRMRRAHKYRLVPVVPGSLTEHLLNLAREREAAANPHAREALEKAEARRERKAARNQRLMGARNG